MTTPVQSAYAQVDANSPTTLALPGSATSGNTIILAVSWFGSSGSTMPTPTDANGTYSTAINTALNAINCGLGVFYVPNCSTGTHSTTVNSSNTAPDFNMYTSVALYEVPGLTASPFDKQNSSTTVNGGAGQTSQATGTTGTLSQANEWVLVACEVDDNPGVTNEALAVPSGFTVDPNIGFALSGVTITGTGGQFSCSAAPTTLEAGQPFKISGTFGGSGSITGYSDPTSYLISATNGSTTFTLETLASAPIVTTAGTPTGLTYIANSFQDTNLHNGGQVGWMDVSSTTALNPSFTIPSRSTLTSLYAGITTWKVAAAATFPVGQIMV